MDDAAFSPPPGNLFADKKMILMLAGGGLLVLFFVVLMIFSFSPQQPVKKIEITPTPQPVKPVSDVYEIESGKTKFSETKYAKFSYKIFPESSLEDQQNLKDFTITKTTNADGSTYIKLIVPDKGYSAVQVTVPKGANAYVYIPKPIEDYGDVGILLTDRNGNILEH